MANIKGKPAVNVNRGKPSHISLVAPADYTFATTKVDAVKDSADARLFFDVVNWKPNSTKKILRIMIRGRGYPSTLTAKTAKEKTRNASKRSSVTVDPPDSGELVITISDTSTAPPPVDKLPVTYVDDPTP